MAIAINGSGTITGLAVGGLPDGCVDSDTLASGVGVKILQVVSAEKTDIQSWTGQSKTEITGLAPTITPSSTSNKILVVGQLWTGCSIGTVTSHNEVERSIDGGTSTLIGNHNTSSDGNGTNAHGHGGTFNGDWNLMNTSISLLDAPNTTSPIVYKWYYTNEGSGTTTYVNRTGRHNTAYHPRTVSTLTLMEVAA